MNPDPESLRAELAAHGMLGPDGRLVALAGGVSSDIYRVEDGARMFVVKRALPKLRVAADWFADPRRNLTEVAYLRTVAQFLPGVVPRVLASSATGAWFAMEHVPLPTWKSQLLAGHCSSAIAGLAGRLLATIHRSSWQNPALRQQFDTTASFRELRTHPYLLATRNRHPALAHDLDHESHRLELTRLALVHGDFSPKNLLVDDLRETLVIVDCEVAWYGDPTFDVAFLLNHLLLKARYRLPQADDYFQLASIFWETYRQHLAPEQADAITTPLPRLLLLLMLARVDGKSPVEYLDAAAQNDVRQFVLHQWPALPRSLEDLVQRWRDSLASLSSP